MSDYDYEIVEIDAPDDRLHQGDVLSWDKRDSKNWKEHGIIITADCDLLHNKMKNRISLVPLISFGTYVQEVWGPEFVSKRVTKILEGSISAIRIAHAEIGRTGVVSEEAILDWISRDQPDMIAAMLFNEEYDAEKRRKFLSKIEAAKNAIDAEQELLQQTSPASYMEKLVSLANKITLNPPADARSNIGMALRGHCTSPPGDVFFLSQVPGDGTGGFFALLRHITQCDIKDIFLESARRPGLALPMRRVGRLKAPYLYALTQNIARVFADIGLPGHYSERRSSSAEGFLSR